ncbi:MAG: hypothetical protein K2J77_10280 [Oscillospiraceae bacterium]|nr:hypothetical protein [Oscillospiraceae bacterium]
MKKTKILAVVLALGLILTGCKSDKSRTSGEISTDSGFRFTSNAAEEYSFSELDIDENKDGVNAFAVMDDNKIAALTFPVNDGEGSFVIYENGKETFRREASVDYQGLCYNAAEKCFYTYNLMEKRLCVMDEEFNLKETLAEGLDAADIRDMIIIDNKLYLLAAEKNPFDPTVQVEVKDPETGYMNFDEKAYSIDLASKKLEDLGVQNVICQSYSNGTLYYFTCRDGHYSLDVFDREAKTLKAVRNMDDVGYTIAFAVIGGEFLYYNPSAGVLKKLELNTGALTAEAGSVFIIRNSQFEVYKDALIYLNINGMTISKYGSGAGSELPTGNIAKYNGESLVIGYQSAYEAPLQTGEINKACGVSASIYECPVYDNELKLELLSGNSDVDIYIFTTGSRLGRDIRSKNGYVPLTDDGIKTAQDKYYDWLADFCVNDNGDIWCVPISADVKVTYYVPDNLTALGIKPEELTTFDGYYSALEKVKAQEKYRYFGTAAYLSYAVLDQNYPVNYGYHDYDSDAFKNAFKRVYDGYVLWEEPEHPLFSNKILSDEWQSGQYILNAESIAFMNDYSFESSVTRPEDWRAVKLPRVKNADEKSGAFITYAIVNPFSKKKEAAQAYLGYIAENGLRFRTERSFLYKDKLMYCDAFDTETPYFSDMFSICEDAAVCEALVELNSDSDVRPWVVEYQRGEITLEQYIANITRITEMAENE